MYGTSIGIELYDASTLNPCKVYWKINRHKIGWFNLGICMHALWQYTRQYVNYMQWEVYIDSQANCEGGRKKGNGSTGSRKAINSTTVSCIWGFEYLGLGFHYLITYICINNLNKPLVFQYYLPIGFSHSIFSLSLFRTPDSFSIYLFHFLLTLCVSCS